MTSNVIDISGHHIDTIISKHTDMRLKALQIIRSKYPMSNIWWRIVNEGHYGKAGMYLVSRYRNNTETVMLSDMLWEGR